MAQKGPLQKILMRLSKILFSLRSNNYLYYFGVPRIC